MKKQIANLILIVILSTTTWAQSSIKNNGSEALISRAIDNYDKGNYASAIDLLKQVSPYDSLALLAEYELALCYNADSTKYPEGEKVLLQSLQRPFNQYRRTMLLQLGYNYDNQKKYDKAFLMYDSVQKNYPNDYGPIYERGASYYKRKMYKEAAEQFEQSLLVNGYHSSSNYFLGQCYLHMGRLTEAFMAMQTSLMVTSDGGQGSRAINGLLKFVNLDDSIINFNKNKAEQYKHELYDEIDELLISKIAFSKDFVSQSKLNDKLVRQFQVICEKVKYDAGDNNFAMQYYVPFYSDIWRQEYFDALAVYCYSGFKIAEVDKYASRIARDINEVKMQWIKYRSQIIGTRTLNYVQRGKTEIKYTYSPENNLFVEGKAAWVKRLNKGDLLEYNGYIKGYVNGCITFEGTREGLNKQGVWKYYYASGIIKSIETYKDDKIVDATFYNNEGVIKRFNKYDDREDVIETSEYRNNGTIANKQVFDNTKISHLTYYHPNEAEQITYDVYKEKEIEDGEYTSYNDNKTIRETVIFKNAKRIGAIEAKNKKGVLVEQGTLIKGEKDGEWITYYNNGAKKEVENFVKGQQDGPYEQYNSKGLVTQKGQFYKNSLDGNIETFDNNGKPLATYIYDKGVLKRTTFHDSILAMEQSAGGRTLRIVNSMGIVSTAIGTNDKGVRNGTYIEYYDAEAKKLEGRYKEGDRVGDWTSYYRNGQIKETTNYKLGKQQGAYTEYYSTGELSKKGNYDADDREGEWIEYFENGVVAEKYFYYGNKLNGPYYYYSANGKLRTIDWYSLGYLTGTTVYDTIGNVIETIPFIAETPKYVLPNIFGNPRFECGRKGGYLHGLFTTKYNNGRISTTGSYNRGDLDGSYTDYNINGSISEQGTYADKKRTGVWTDYDELGRKMYESTYDEDGEITLRKYFIGEVLIWEQEYYSDERHGKKTYFNELKKPIGIIYYNSDYITGYSACDAQGNALGTTKIIKGKAAITINYPDGKPAVVLNFAQGELNGKQLVYYSNGQIAEERNMNLIGINGMLRKYFTNGKMMYEGNFVNGNNQGAETLSDNSGRVLGKANYNKDKLNGNIEYVNDKSGITEVFQYNNGVLLNNK
jgi:uncharacterized protein